MAKAEECHSTGGGGGVGERGRGEMKCRRDGGLGHT